MSFHNAFNLPLVIVRPFNTYGPRQSARAVIPTVITQIANGAKQIQLGALSPTRDFNYVQDTVNGFIAALGADHVDGEVINLGSNFEISVGDTVTLIAKIMQADVSVVQDPQRLRPDNSEVERLWADNQKAKTLLNWTPAYAGLDGLARGLAETVAWFTQAQNLSAYKSTIYNV
jgi:dTDP-glucose 4,6-dehydratase